MEDLPVPRTRRGFRTQLFKWYQRRKAELDEAICRIFVKGMSRAEVGTVMEALTGNQPNPATVSRVFPSLEAECAAWKNRLLKAHDRYVYADGTYFSV